MPLNDTQRRLKRSKQSERDLGHWLMKHDGPDPRMRGLTTSTGRVGHLTHLQFDVLSRTYVAENKQVKVPARMFAWWRQITEIAAKQGKDALLRIEPTNVDIQGRHIKVPEMHIITAERHAELLGYEEDAWKYRELSK